MTTVPSTPPAEKTTEKTKLLNRLKRIEGQVRGLQRMVEDERDCREILTLLAGVRSALDASSDLIFATYLERCQHDLQNGRSDVQEILNALRLARR